MIFLAVTLGFFAESIRENIADNSKEKEYISAMIEDAKTDTPQYSRCNGLKCKKSIVSRFACCILF